MLSFIDFIASLPAPFGIALGALGVLLCIVLVRGFILLIDLLT